VVTPHIAAINILKQIEKHCIALYCQVISIQACTLQPTINKPITKLIAYLLTG